MYLLACFRRDRPPNRAALAASQPALNNLTAPQPIEANAGADVSNNLHSKEAPLGGLEGSSPFRSQSATTNHINGSIYHDVPEKVAEEEVEPHVDFLGASTNSNISMTLTTHGILTTNPMATQYLEGHLLPAGVDISDLQFLLDSNQASVHGQSHNRSHRNQMATTDSITALTATHGSGPQEGGVEVEVEAEGEVPGVSPLRSPAKEQQVVRLCQPEELMGDLVGLTFISRGSRSVVCLAQWRGARVAVQFRCSPSLQPDCGPSLQPDCTAPLIRRALLSKALAHPNLLQHFSMRCCRLLHTPAAAAAATPQTPQPQPPPSVPPQAPAQTSSQAPEPSQQQPTAHLPLSPPALHGGCGSEVQAATDTRCSAGGGGGCGGGNTKPALAVDGSGGGGSAAGLCEEGRQLTATAGGAAAAQGGAGARGCMGVAAVGTAPLAAGTVPAPVGAPPLHEAAATGPSCADSFAPSGVTATASAADAASAAKESSPSSNPSPSSGPSAADVSFNSYEGFGDPYGSLRHGLSLAHVAALVCAREGDHLTATIMEHADKSTLQSAVQRGLFVEGRVWSGRVALRALLRTAAEVAAGLQHLHSRQVVHGALRPAAVLLGSASRDRRGFTAKVGGLSHARVCGSAFTKAATSHFGGIMPAAAAAEEPAGTSATAAPAETAAAVGAAASSSSSRHSSGPAYTWEAEGASSGAAVLSAATAADLPFLAPEQMRGEVGKPSDVYAFGVTLYVMASGTLPYMGLTAPAIASGVVHGSLRPQWPPRTFKGPQQQHYSKIRDLCARCWQSDPWVRPTLAAICASLQEIEDAVRQQLRTVWISSLNNNVAMGATDSLSDRSGSFTRSINAVSVTVAAAAAAAAAADAVGAGAVAAAAGIA